MSTSPRKSGTVCLAGVAGLMLLGVSAASAAEVAPPTVPKPGSNVRIRDQIAAAAVRRALEGAAERLRSARCAQVLSDFTDLEGRSLRRNLAASGHTAQGYLSRIYFYDGSNRACRVGTHHMTTIPGSRVVRVCGRRMARLHPDRAEIFVIHEMLHSLGLGENPPSSHEITRQVEERCQDEPQPHADSEKERREREHSGVRERPWPGGSMTDDADNILGTDREELARLGFQHQAWQAEALWRRAEFREGQV